ncbi:MAG: RICIN domain-containing protein [Saprospiraceae bacterium]
MKKSALKIKIMAIPALWLFGLIIPTLKAQTYSDNSGHLLADGAGHTVPYQNREYLDLKIPQSTDGQYLYLWLEGADGGRFRKSTDHLWVRGGEGASVVLVVEVGNGTGQLPVGSTLRFIVGEKGGENSTSGLATRGAGSGGGTGLAFRGPGQNDKWQLLAVAGAGSGGMGSCCGGHGDGIEGDPGRDIVATLPSSSTGVGGYADQDLGYKENFCLAGAGGGAFSQGQSMTYNSVTMWGGYPGWAGGPNSGTPTGGKGGQNSGWGFGGGGSSRNDDSYRTGGGGGYKGGDVTDPSALNEHRGEEFTGDGGGSFYHEAYAKIGYAIVNGRTTSPGDGYVFYNFFDGPLFKSIHFAYNPNKCIDDYRSSTSNGNNIQTYTCTGNTNQLWYLNTEDRTIRSKLNINKCLDLDNSNTANGTNIQLLDCRVSPPNIGCTTASTKRSTPE